MLEDEPLHGTEYRVVFFFLEGTKDVNREVSHRRTVGPSTTNSDFVFACQAGCRRVFVVGIFPVVSNSDATRERQNMTLQGSTTPT